MNKVRDCQPTLNDSQVFSFCRDGYLMLEGVVPDEINQRTTQFIDQYGHRTLLEKDWFIDNVLLNSQVVGVIRSLLGTNFKFEAMVGSKEWPPGYAVPGQMPANHHNF